MPYRRTLPGLSTVRAIAILAAGLLLACNDDEGRAGVSVVENELYGRILNEDGSAAAKVPVELYKADSAGAEVGVDSTDGEGRFRFPSLPPGRYSALARREGALAFLDGLELASRDLDAGERRLRQGGSVSTVVALRPGDDPASVTAVVLGTGYRSTPDAGGDMGMDGMPEGALRIRITSSLPGYLPLEATLNIISGKETLVDTLHLPQAR